MARHGHADQRDVAGPGWLQKPQLAWRRGTGKTRVPKKYQRSHQSGGRERVSELKVSMGSERPRPIHLTTLAQGTMRQAITQTPFRQ